MLHGNPEKALQIVTAYDINELIVVAQTEIKDKTNEITAGRELIDMMDLSNTIITADAIHCQKETMKKIVEKGGDCIIQLNANQKALHNDINVFFDEKIKEQAKETLEYLGTNFTNVINMLLRQIILTESIPFEVKVPKLNAETIKAMEDVEKGKGLSKEYADLAEMWKDLEKED